MTANHSTIDPHAVISRATADGGTMFLFNFGAVVFWNVEEAVQLQTIGGLADRKLAAVDNFYVEEYLVSETDKIPQVDFSSMNLDYLNHERAEVIASTLAQSSAMSFYEDLVEQAWVSVDELMVRLETHGNLGITPKPLHKQVARAVLMRSQVVRVLHLLDRPDLVWEDKTMDGLYGDLRSTFDLPERFQALEYKLQLIQQSLELLVDTARDTRLYWLEFAIVFLILFEVIMSLYDRFLKDLF
jgi:required for meiotic nuclear division protein 1